MLDSFTNVSTRFSQKSEEDLGSLLDRVKESLVTLERISSEIRRHIDGGNSHLPLELLQLTQHFATTFPRSQLEKPTVSQLWYQLTGQLRENWPKPVVLCGFSEVSVGTASRSDFLSSSLRSSSIGRSTRRRSHGFISVLAGCAAFYCSFTRTTLSPTSLARRAFFTGVFHRVSLPWARISMVVFSHDRVRLKGVTDLWMDIFIAFHTG